ncbi:hypothetical protein Pla100_60640 [Neorhodopirellula pilleata]|uniref:Uncharacterized protein n=1 Tax=Neorhodopirellula pilleata TaxID=2714738 RepID=A0A5C5ZG87_9BACT|nr:hypothetical protein Pla100_60640 [Neorhodopirellula pilleata]
MNDFKVTATGAQYQEVQIDRRAIAVGSKVQRGNRSVTGHTPEAIVDE